MANKIMRGRNTTGTDYYLARQLYTNGAPGLWVDVDPEDFRDYAISADVKTKLASGDFEVDDGGGTAFSAADGLRWVESLDQTSILEGDLYDKTGRADKAEWFWDGPSSRWKMRFGQKYAESLVDSSTSSQTYVQKMRLTTVSLLAGDYRIGWSVEIEASDDKGNPLFQIEVDDTTQIHETDTLNSPKDNSFGYSGFDVVTLTAGTHDIDLDIRDEGKKTMFARNARLEIKPV